MSLLDNTTDGIENVDEDDIICEDDLISIEEWKKSDEWDEPTIPFRRVPAGDQTGVGRWC